MKNKMLSLSLLLMGTTYAMEAVTVYDDSSDEDASHGTASPPPAGDVPEVPKAQPDDRYQRLRVNDIIRERASKGSRSFNGKLPR